MSAPKRDPFDLCGTTIDGKYRVDRVVGEGGFGVVYRGVHQGFESPVAIKCLKLPPHLDEAEQESLVGSLRDEGRLLLRLSRRTSGIVQAHDVGAITLKGPGSAVSRVPYLVLEWLDGRTLADELRARRPAVAAERGSGMPLLEAIHLLAPAARALAVAHEENVAHRDIKPENLFLVGSGAKTTIKVLDFGIAKVFAEAPSAAAARTGAGPRAFTPAYAAPEQFDRRRGATGPWTDVYALALVLVEVASGRRAQDGDDFASLFTAAVDPDHRPSLRAAGVSAPEAVERVVLRALSVEPAARYPDAGAFWDAIEAAAAPVSASPPAAEALALAGTVQVSTDRDLSTGQFAAEHGLGGIAASSGPGSPGAGDPEAPLAGSSRSGAHAGRGPATGHDGATGHNATPSLEIPSGPPSAVGPTSAPLGTTRGLSVTARLSSGGSRTRSILGAVVLAAAAGAAALFALRDRPVPDPPAAASSGLTPSASAAAGKSGESSVPEAQAQLKDALQAWLDGSIEVAVRAAEKAVSLDPGFGAAELRLALWKFDRKPTEARDHFQSAQLHRASLSQRDQGLLHATEPYLREPWDLAEWTARLEALQAAHPDDPEITIYLGLSNHVRLRLPEAVAAFDRALAKDPALVGAWVLKADSLSMKGDAAAQAAAYEACLQKAPMAGQCLSRQVVLFGRTGQCEAMRDGAKRLLAMTPKSAATQRQLAVALFATGAPRDGVLESLSRGWGLLPDDERPAREGNDRFSLALLEGDFPAAEKALVDWAAAVKDKTNQTHHAEPALALADLHEETGDAKKAGAVADAFVRRMGALSEPTAGDWAMAFLPFRLRAGLIDQAEYTRERAAWSERVRKKWQNAGRRLDEELDWILWLSAHGNVVRTEEGAREAVAAMPQKPSSAVQSGRWTAMDLAIGRAHVLGGDASAALPHLQRASRSCLGLSEPALPARVWLHLGLALEKTGDVAGARAAYEKVLSLWGRAKPRSVTAARAKQLLSSLPKSR